MIAIKLYALIAIYFTVHTCNAINYELINVFYNVKSVPVIYVFHCLNDGISVQWRIIRLNVGIYNFLLGDIHPLRVLLRTGKRFSFYNIKRDNVNLDKFCDDNYDRIGIVLDIECKNAQNVLISVYNAIKTN